MTASQESTDAPFIFTTLRWDSNIASGGGGSAEKVYGRGAFYLLPNHFRRLHDAYLAIFNDARNAEATHFPFPSPRELESVLGERVDEELQRKTSRSQDISALRMKLMIYRDGHFQITSLATIPSVSATTLLPTTLDDLPDAINAPALWEVFLDEQAVEPSTSTRYKTDDRRVYDTARNAAAKRAASSNFDVLLAASSGHIIDGSITTPYFFRGGKWVTPPASSGGLQGTSRRWALEHDICVEGIIEKRTLRNNETIWLSNAVRGFFRAVIVL